MADIHDLVAPYALDALDAEERDSFEGHLDGCESCRIELARLTESAADVAASVATRPPSHVKESVLSAISEDDQRAVVHRLEDRRSSGWLVASVAAVVALVFFGLWLTTDSRLDDANLVAAVYEAPDAQVIEVDTSNGTARFVYSPSLQRGVFNGGALAAIDESSVYQLWLIGDEGPVSAGTLTSGESDVLVDAVDAGLTLAMTVETAPGAEAPTSDPLFATDI